MDSFSPMFKGNQGQTNLGIPTVPALTAAQILSTLARGVPTTQGLTPMPGGSVSPVGIPRPSAFTAPGTAMPTGLGQLISGGGTSALNQSLSGTLSGLYQSMLPPPVPPAPLGGTPMGVVGAGLGAPGGRGEAGPFAHPAVPHDARSHREQEGPGGWAAQEGSEPTRDPGHEIAQERHDEGEHQDEEGDGSQDTGGGAPR